MRDINNTERAVMIRTIDRLEAEKAELLKALEIFMESGDVRAARRDTGLGQGRALAFKAIAKARGETP